MHRAFVICILSVLAFAGWTESSKFKINSDRSDSEPIGATPLIGHVIAHTHDDVGWLKTVDQYYYGANQSIQDAGVQYILDAVIPALEKDPEKKFIYVEIAFFERWWGEQNDYTKQIVRNLVTSGRLEFINGGWCMNDEASTHYAAIIEQMTEGHEFLWREFGVRPRIGWHIDPFGHAATQASLFAQMGFDAFLFGRIEFGDHNVRNATKELEFVWRGSPSLGKETEIFSHVLYTDYCYVSGTGWEYGAEPIMDDPRLFDVNIKQKADAFVKLIRQRSLAYRTEHILIPFGCDFRFMNADINFKNMDKLMKYINARHSTYGLTLKYSTPSIYVDSVHSKGLTWSVKTGDFFPYADNAHSYWTGYFTSRSALKGYVRQMNNLVHSADKLFASAFLPLSDETERTIKRLDVLTQAFSVAQHHDAVSGTEKQHVAYDYAKRLYIGQAESQNVMSEVFANLIHKNKAPTAQFDFCPLLNQSLCSPLDVLKSGEAVAIVVYNPIGWKRNDYARLPVPTANVQVVDSSGTIVASQVYANADRSGYYTLVFPLTDIPPMGFTTYIIGPSSGSSKTKMSNMRTIRPMKDDADTVLENDLAKVIVSGSTGRLSAFTNKLHNISTQISQDFLWWNGSAGNTEQDHGQASGAYIFRPNGTTPFPITKGNPNPGVTVVDGDLVQEVRQVWSPWVKQTLRLYKRQPFLELEATVGPIDISDGLGKEVISRFTSDLSTRNTWYTDSQGQDMMTRILNYRPWKNYTVTEPIASNYYPMNTAAYMKEEQGYRRQLTWVTDRSRGCASLSDGEFEYMVHRRLLYDDARGVGEPLNETDIVRTSQLLFLDLPQSSARQQRYWDLLLNNPVSYAFAPIKSGNPQDWLNNYKTHFSPLTGSLPENVHLVNFKMTNDGEYLVRLHHLYGAGEDSDLSKTVEVDLNGLFAGHQVLGVTEMTLTANRPLSELRRLKWKTANNNDLLEKEFNIISEENMKRTPLASTIVKLKAMDMKTFLVRFSPSN